MHNKINLLGINFESINTAVFLASLDWQVHLIADKNDIQKTLDNYQFDRQLSLLWQLYTSDNKILIKNQIESFEHYWLFFDEANDFDVKNLTVNPNSQIILSGSKPLNFFEDFARGCPSNWVYYVPFNFLKDGHNFNAFFHIELLLIGEKSYNSVKHSHILQSLIKNSKKHHIDNIKTIEFARASINAMLATRLSFINEMARLADSQKIDIKSIQKMMGMDSRIGGEYLKAGWGFGGKSLPSELNFLMQSFNANGVDTALLKSVLTVNDDQKELIFRKFWRYFDGNIENKTVVIWGAGYRSETSKTTGSAIHQLLKLCWAYEIKTFVYGVHTVPELTTLYGDSPLFNIINTPYENLANAHALFILNWSDKQQIDLNQLNEVALPIFDGKNILSEDEIKQYQGNYVGIGRKQ
ncbi:UDP-glucose 6-dehydrogenase ywqF [Moraxella caprae]|uniref:UDP-glucose 6-dehydrogenase n=1 Tax=Moraxella caprae TaxID=90240 RepID=A0A378QXQ4_9GAMM|nr:UDP-glucose/GDP-mannose dehydrogenase family protein [Moraxella caprae]STZ07772.1 UDP-glucose 6-dehydrogenase ywqF [Moraxella caprae]